MYFCCQRIWVFGGLLGCISDIYFMTEIRQRYLYSLTVIVNEPSGIAFYKPFIKILVIKFLVLETLGRSAIQAGKRNTPVTKQTSLTSNGTILEGVLCKLGHLFFSFPLFLA